VNPFTPDRLMFLVCLALSNRGMRDMQRAAAVVGLVLFSVVGVAHADSPGGWSQFDQMVAKAQGQPKVAQVQQVPQTTPVYEFATGQKPGTWVSPANPNQGATN